jgi:hypothetical protein
MKKRRSAAEIERLIVDFKSSGHTVASYCKKNRVNPASLYQILKRHRSKIILARKESMPAVQKNRSAFIPVTVLPEAQESRVNEHNSQKFISLKNSKWELKIEPGTDVNWLAQLLKVVQ